MKKLLLFLSITSLLGCASGNEEKTITWVKDHQKPIKCIYVGINHFSERKYTLIAADGQVFSTGNVTFKFPENITAK